MKVQIVRKESIKPSSPTPPLTTFNLSYIDQLAPPIYVPFLFFYSNDDDNKIESSEKLHLRLKKSLSDTLTTFYPLAGRINKDYNVECNDEGVDYVEGKVDVLLSDFIAQPSVDVLKMLLPCSEPYLVEYGSEPPVLLGIQVNVFSCGGAAISVCLSHEVGDMNSLITFITCWAAKTRNANEVLLHPLSDWAPQFPQRDLLGFVPGTGIRRNVVTKRFLFDSSSIAFLREQASNDSFVAHPTRIEAVSAFMWRRSMEMAKAKDARVKAYAALHTVNLRGRMEPSQLLVEGPKSILGNLVATVIACQEVEASKELHVLVKQIRDAIKGMNSETVRRMQSGHEYLISLMTKLRKYLAGEMALLMFTSLSRFPVYEADFGWGKPVWVSTTGIFSPNVVMLLDSRSGDGMEAWVNMFEEDMAEYEELLLASSLITRA